MEDFDQYTDEDVIDCLYTGLADEMLSNTQGQHALGVSFFVCITKMNPLFVNLKQLISTVMQITGHSWQICFSITNLLFYLLGYSIFCYKIIKN